MHTSDSFPSEAFSDVVVANSLYVESFQNSELTGTAPTFNQDTTGNSANAPKWDGAKKYVQSSEPSGAANGDIWFKV